MEENKNEVVAGATQDESIDVAALVRNAKDSIPAPTEASETPAENSTVDRVLSPLEQLQREDKNAGLVVEKEDLIKGHEGPVKNMSMRFDDAFEKKIAESDALIENRKHVVIVKKVVTEQDMIEASLELEGVKFNETTQTYYFDLKDAEGNPVKPVYFRIRTAEDGEYDIVKEAANVDVDLTKPEGETPTDADKVEVIDEELTEEEKEKREKKALVEIIIDKTNQGTNVEFTQEERAKMYEASEIRIREVQTVNIPTSKVRRAKKDESFLSRINAVKLGRDAFTVYFPASGFRADMVPLTYGELNDIAIDTEDGEVTVDKYIKRMTIIYNHMTNISIGSFDSFDDFLQGFAYTDISLAVYGLFVSTFPEVQQIDMSCGACKKGFPATYATRDVYNLESCSLEYLKHVRKVMEAVPADYDKVRNESPVMVEKVIEMPESHILFSIGIATAYDYIYNFIPVSDADKFMKQFPDDINMTQGETLALLFGIRATGYKDPETDEYVKYDSFKDILDAVYSISPEEIKLLTAILQSSILIYTPIFAVENVKCTHCGTETPRVPIDIDSLVFTTVGRLKNTQISVSNMLD